MASRIPATTLHEGFHFPAGIEGRVKQLEDFEVRADDIFVVCYPKCGTTWLEQVVYLIVHGLDYDDPYGITIEKRIPYLEFPTPGLESIKSRVGQRIMKSHVPYSLLPPGIHNGKGKLISIARNPKDVMVSQYHFYRMNKMSSYEGDFNSFYQLFIDDKVMYGPYVKQLEEIVQHRNDDNVLLIHYEDMKKDLGGSVKTLAEFLQRPQSEQQIDAIVQKCTFKNMKDDPTCNYSWWDKDGFRKQGEAQFMRKGEVGDWKNYFTQEMSTKIDEIYSPLEKQGLLFKYEL